MNQILHIFRKDTRRFLPEIVLYLLILVAYVLDLPGEWRMFGPNGLDSRMQEIATVTLLLVPLIWWLLVARVTHAETLVGDEQFWLTRPYQWNKLLTAKVLFLAVWICAPYLLAQSILLSEAGFSPAPHLAGLLVNLCAMAAMPIVPLFALAAVSKNFARMTLALVGILVLITSFMFALSATNQVATSNPYRDVFAEPLMFALCAAAVVVQYATRRVWLARALLMAVPVVLIVLMQVYSRQSLVDRAYPAPTSASAPPLHIELAASPAHPVQARTWHGSEFIDLPLQYSGVPDGYAIFSDNYKFTLIAADGFQWTSPWQINDDHILPGTHRAQFALQLSPALYDRFKSSPVTLQLTSALTRLQAGEASTGPFPTREVALPGVGICSTTWRTGSHLVCRSPAGESGIIRISGVWSHPPCSATQPAPETTADAGMWLRAGNFTTFSLPISSISTENLWFNNNKGTEHDNNDTWRICPGSPLTATPYHPIDRTRTTLTIPNFQLPATLTQTGY